MQSFDANRECRQMLRILPIAYRLFYTRRADCLPPFSCAWYAAGVFSPTGP